jgi:hypothetical protein
VFGRESKSCGKKSIRLNQDLFTLDEEENLLYCTLKLTKKEKVVYTFTWNQARKLEYELERTMDAVVNDICYDCVAKYDEIIVEID